MNRRFEDYLNEELKDPDFAREYHLLGPVHQIAEQVITLRQARGLTQVELACLVGTQQSSISRLENGTSAPSLSFLLRVADALNTELEICLRPKDSHP